MRRLLLLFLPLFAALLAAMAPVLLPAGAVPVRAQTTEPHPVARVNSPRPGCNQQFLVSGDGWPANTQIEVAVDGVPGVTTLTNDTGSFEGPMPLIILHCPGGGSFTLRFSAPAFPSAGSVEVPVTMLASGGDPPTVTGKSTSPRAPDTGSGTAPTGPSTREIILLAGAGSLFVGIVLLASLAALSHSETPTRNR